MDLEFINPHSYAVQLPGPNRQIIQIPAGKKRKLPEFYKRYCPKYIRLVGNNAAQSGIPYSIKRGPGHPRRLQQQKSSVVQSKAKRATKRKTEPTSKPASHDSAPTINKSHIAVGILSCNRPRSLKRLLTSIHKHTDRDIAVFVSDDSDQDKNAIRHVMGKYPWVRFIDNKCRAGIVGNTNRLLTLLRPYRYKLILNDDVEILARGWESFYVNAMVKTGYHHFCYRQHGIYGASGKQERVHNINNTSVKTIRDKPQGAVLAFDNVAFETVGYYDSQFPKYGMSHVDWSNRVSLSGIQAPGFHDVAGSDKFFKVHDDKSATQNRIQLYKDAKSTFNKVRSNKKRIYVDCKTVDLQDRSDTNKCLFAISTYNRLDYLQKTIQSWDRTRNKARTWNLIVADDGSNDGTIEYLRDLQIDGVEIFIILNSNRGIHHQTNEILNLSRTISYDVGWKSDDDIIFKKAGWDDAYIYAINQTGYDHLCFYDESWGKKRKPRDAHNHVSNLLVNKTHSEEVQGALWTFTPRVLDKVGYFDVDKYNLCGWGHTDFTFRCCKAGFNDKKHVFDVRDSNEYISLIDDGYNSAPNENRYDWNDAGTVAQKKQSLTDNRVFVKYKRHPQNLSGSKVPQPKISFVIPIRGRREHIPGLLDNLEKYFSDYEVIFAEQDDDEMFKRGQLCNLGFLQSHGDIIIFQDVDIRHLNKLDISSHLETFGRPFIAFDRISQLTENNGKYNLLETKERLQAYGACAVFTRSQFVASHGFSNLIIGWGGEDNLMNERARFARLKQALGHVKHEAPSHAKIWNTDWHRRNVELWQSDKSRVASLDGYVQTIATLTDSISDGKLYTHKFKNIRTSKNFAYRHLF